MHKFSKSLTDTILQIQEAAKRKVVDVNNLSADDVPGTALNGKVLKNDKWEQVEPGDSSTENGTKGTWSVDYATPEDLEAWKKLDKKTISKNLKRIITKLNSNPEEGVGAADFFVQGEAGWAKTAFIEKAAKMRGYHVITVYLDKAVPEDLEGIPVPTKDEKTGRLWTPKAIPGWALYMMEHPDENFLLFFDEMNQASGELQNALMPIILKKQIAGIQFHNYVVGAAGNFSDENDYVQELSDPLRQRFTLVKWDSHTDETWDAHFQYAHKNWEDRIGSEIIDKLSEYREFWSSPRDLERKVYEWIVRSKRQDCVDDPDEILGYLETILNRHLTDSEKESRKCHKALEETAQLMYDAATGNIKPAKKSRGRGKDAAQVDEKWKNVIMDALENGYIEMSSAVFEEGDGETYIVTAENLCSHLLDPVTTGVTAEVLEDIVEYMENQGRNVKYPTNADYEKNKAAQKKAKADGWRKIFTDADEEKFSFSPFGGTVNMAAYKRMTSKKNND